MAKRQLNFNFTEEQSRALRREYKDYVGKTKSTYVVGFNLWAKKKLLRGRKKNSIGGSTLLIILAITLATISGCGNNYENDGYYLGKFQDTLRHQKKKPTSSTALSFPGGGSNYYIGQYQDSLYRNSYRNNSYLDLYWDIQRNRAHQDSGSYIDRSTYMGGGYYLGEDSRPGHGEPYGEGTNNSMGGNNSRCD
jgi:hypothetical protein